MERAKSCLDRFPLIVDRHPLFIAALAVLFIKLAAFAADHTPLFFMGDSKAYIGSALHGHILHASSSGYAFPVRWFAVWPGTLTTLVLAQVLAGAVTAWLLSVILLRFFNVLPLVAITGAVVCALEPLQMIHERLVLAEAFTQLLFATYLLLALWYLSLLRLLLLFAVCLMGIVLVSFRVVYVPLALSSALILPTLALRSLSLQFDRAMKRCILHLLVGVITTISLHAAYRHLIGSLTIGSPTYLPGTNLQMAAAWLPFIRPEDVDDPRARRVFEEVFPGSTANKRIRLLRDYHRWKDNGLIPRLGLAFGGDESARNQAARGMIEQAFRRNPFAPVKLTVQTYGDYWRVIPILKKRLLTEHGTGRKLDPKFLQVLRDEFGLDAVNIPFTMTPSKRYHLSFRPWYIFLLVSPLLILLSIPLSRTGCRVPALLVFLNSIILLGATCAGALYPFWRYLLPLTFTTLLAFGVIADFLYRRVSAGGDWAGHKPSFK